MIYISEQETAAAITHELAYEAVFDALIAATRPASKVFPAVIAHGSDKANRFSVKAGVSEQIGGAKMGFNWPSNKLRGLPSHNSVTILLDQEVGGIAAVIESGLVNAYRTAAADAIATDVLARKDARVLTVFGAGNQAGYECMAIARIRRLDEVLVVARTTSGEDKFIDRVAKDGLKARAVDPREGCQAADIIITATPSQAPLFDAGWVRSGTHVSCMGTDSKGKQELPVGLLHEAKLFCDLPEQSVTIGEFQHVFEEISSGHKQLTAIGKVLAGEAAGRTTNEEITVFDSSGISLQDLYMANRLLTLLRPLGIPQKS